MAAVSRENWVERIRDPKIECMSRDEMAALQSRRLVEVVNRVYNNVEFYRKKMQDMGIEPGDIKSIEDIGKLPFTTKEDLRENYPFGLLAIPKKDVVRVQGTSGTTGKLTIAPYSQKDVEVWGGMCGKRTDDGRTYRGRYYTCLLWLWSVYRRPWTGFWSKSARGNGDSDVCRQYKASDDVYGRSWSHCICVYAFVCFVSCRIHSRSRDC